MSRDLVGSSWTGVRTLWTEPVILGAMTRGLWREAGVPPDAADGFSGDGER
jgi:hypothetical protein